MRRLFAFSQHALFWLLSSLLEWLYVLVFCPAFLPSLWRMLEWSLVRSPYRAARNPRGETPKELTYGEVLLPTLDRLLRELGAGPNDLLLDLGAGRGRIVLFAAAKGIPARGIELVKELVEAANYAAVPLNQAHFTCGDVLQEDLSGATILWVVGTCWNDDTLNALAQKVQAQAPTAKVISVSGPLPHLDTIRCLEGWTSWGRDRFYLQRTAHPTDAS